MTTPSAVPLADAPADRSSPGRSGQFRRPSAELDADDRWPLAVWFVSGAIIAGLAWWAILELAGSVLVRAIQAIAGVL